MRLNEVVEITKFLVGTLADCHWVDKWLLLHSTIDPDENVCEKQWMCLAFIDENMTQHTRRIYNHWMTVTTVLMGETMFQPYTCIKSWTIEWMNEKKTMKWWSKNKATHRREALLTKCRTWTANSNILSVQWNEPCSSLRKQTFLNCSHRLQDGASR